MKPISWPELREIYFLIDTVRRLDRGEYTVAYEFEFTGAEMKHWPARVIDLIYRIRE